jgi:hypothetical protein
VKLISKQANSRILPLMTPRHPNNPGFIQAPG